MTKHVLILLVIGFIAFVVFRRSTHESTHAFSTPRPIASQSGQAAKVSQRAAQPLASGQKGQAAVSTANAPLSPNPPPAAPSTLPRRLADITLSAAAEKEIEKRASEYFWGPAQYRETLDVKLEIFARMAECMEGTVPFGQVDVDLSFDPIPGNSKLVLTKAVLRGNSLPTRRDYLRAKMCVEMGLLGIDQPILNPALAKHTVMYLDVHFPIDSNPLYELLRSGVEPQIESLTEAQYQEH